MASQLTPQQVADLEQCGGRPLVVEDPKNRRGYVLIPTAAYEQAKPIIDAIIAKERKDEEVPCVEWNEDLNGRRHALIDKKYGSGLTVAETQELADLQAAVGLYQRRVAPLPLAMLDLMLEGLKHRVEAAKPSP